MVSAAGITATLLAALPVLGLGGVGVVAAPSSESGGRRPSRGQPDRSFSKGRQCLGLLGPGPGLEAINPKP